MIDTNFFQYALSSNMGSYRNLPFTLKEGLHHYKLTLPLDTTHGGTFLTYITLVILIVWGGFFPNR